MRIKLVCYSYLGIYCSGDGELEVESGTCIEDVLDMLGVPRNDVAMSFIGEVRVDLNNLLVDGDILKLFPPITGG